MPESTPQERIAELEEKLRLVTLENDALAERAEETLLLGMIAEKINALDDPDEVIKVGLEQAAILKAIPYAACFFLVEGRALGRHVYTLHDNPRFGKTAIDLAPEFLEKLDGGIRVLRGEQHAVFPYAEGAGCLFQPSLSIILGPDREQENPSLLVFATDTDPDRLEAMGFLLPRVVEMINGRLNNLVLLDRLQAMNELLDQKVHERTAKLRDIARRLQTLFESSYDSFMVIDHDLNLREVNTEACRSLGYTREELLKLRIPDFVVRAEDYQLGQIGAQAAQQGVMRLDSLHRRKDGTTFPVEVQLGPIRVGEEDLLLAQARDMSERNRLRQQLSQAQKMEAVGRLAGGIAHDFNNILTTIMGHVDLLKMDLGDRPEAIEDLDLIQETTEKAARLTHQLLAFSRKQVIEMETFNLNQNFTALTRMLQRMITENIELVIDLDPDAGCIFGDPGRVEQIMVNLVINARDAMPQGGHLKVATRRVDPEEGFPEPYFEQSNLTGKYIRVEVRDTGEGIPEDLLSKIFDPFFTTKEVGKGSGLGLAMVYGLARQHRAAVRVESTLGQGSVFQVFFPEVEADGAPVIRSRGQFLTGGEEQILLVEDDPSIRQILSRMITRLGYRLIVASNGVEALDLVKAHQGPLDLVLTDVIMPRMGGGELVDQLRTSWPEIKVIYISGYTDDDLCQGQLAKPDTRFIQKPVAYGELSEELRHALGKGAGS